MNQEQRDPVISNPENFREEIGDRIRKVLFETPQAINEARRLLARSASETRELK